MRLDLSFLRPFGPVALFEQFSRPFYRMDRAAMFVLTGILDSADIRVTFKRTAAPHIRALLERQLDKMTGCDGCGDCVRLCPEDALKVGRDRSFSVDDTTCTSCLECVAGPCGVLNVDPLIAG